MTENTLLRQTRVVLWFIVTVLTGILAGFITSYVVMLGRYFVWLIESGNYRVFTDTFAPFRLATDANHQYDMFLGIQLLAGILWSIVCFITRKDRILAIVAGLSSFWVGVVFYATDFADIEEAVCSGVADGATQRMFAAMNIPLHAGFAAFYTLCFILMLYFGIRAARTSMKERAANRV